MNFCQHLFKPFLEANFHGMKKLLLLHNVSFI